MNLSTHRKSISPKELAEGIAAARRMFGVVSKDNTINGKRALRPVYKNGELLGRITWTYGQITATSKNANIPILRNTIWL